MFLSRFPQIVVFTLGLCLSLGTTVRAQWKHFADFTDTQDLVATQDRLVGASSRGVWFFEPPEGDDFLDEEAAADAWAHYSLPHGLLGVRQNLLCYSNDQLFFGASDAAISSCDSAGDQWSRGFLEFREHEQIVSLHDLCSTGERFLVSHDTGVTLMHYQSAGDEFLVDWNLHTLGDFPVQEPILAAATLGSRIAFASSLGLAVGEGFPSTPVSIETFQDLGEIQVVAKAQLVAGSERLYAVLTDDVGFSLCYSIGA